MDADSQSLAERRTAYVSLLEENLSRIVDCLARMPEVHRIVLFGSYAAGRRDLFTDLDLLVVMESPLDYITRTADLYRRLPASVDLDLLVYTPQEMERMLTAEHRPFLSHIFATGKVLYEKNPTG